MCPCWQCNVCGRPWLIYGAFCAAVGRELVASFGIRGVEGLSLEWVSKNLYFTESGGFIGVIRLRSQHFHDVRRLITDLGNPRAIVVNPYVG